MKVSICLFGLDMLDLPLHLKTVFLEQTCLFDRIDASDLAERDAGCLANTLYTLGSLLKPIDANPNAALLTSFLGATQVMEKRSRLRTKGMSANTPPHWRYLWHLIYPNADDEETFQHIVFHAALGKFLPFPKPVMRAVDPDALRITFATRYFIDFDKFFDQYMAENYFRSAGEAAGLMMREEHRIVKPWPYALDLTVTDEEAKRKFDLLHASARTGGERYVKWVRRR